MVLGKSIGLCGQNEEKMEKIINDINDYIKNNIDKIEHLTELMNESKNKVLEFNNEIESLKKENSELEKAKKKLEG